MLPFRGLGRPLLRLLVPGHRRALVAGWFSFPDTKATFGDSRAMEVVCRWLREAGIPFDVAGDERNHVSGIAWDAIEPAAYTIFVFVCGPWWDNPGILDRFRHCLTIGIDLTVHGADTLGFDVLIPRDGLGEANPDLVLASDTDPVPVAGVALVHPQPPYGDRQRHERVQAVVDEFLAAGTVAPLYLDTLLLNNPGRLTTADQFAALVRRTDVMVTTRLHGLVFALLERVPAVAIDPIAGGAKVTAQARALDWPLLLAGETLSAAELADHVHHCAAGRLATEVERCRARAIARLGPIRERFLAAVANRSGAAGWQSRRRAA